MSVINAYFIDTDSFGVSGIGDQTGKFHVDRRIQAWMGNDGIAYGTIESSSYAAGSDVNTINLTADSDTLTANLQHVKYGIVGASPSGSLPSHTHEDDTGQGGTVDHGVLDGLGDDDHTQYHNNTRGDARYYQQSEVDTLSQEASANAYNQAIAADISDHGDLSGLNDDDHTQYMPVDASRSFSNPVSGQTPTLDEHLATKLYTDSASANALTQAETYSEQASANAYNQAIAADVDEFDELTDTPSDYSGKGNYIVRVKSTEDGLEFAPSGAGGVTDHGDLTGLGDDDHTQYILADGSRAFSQPVSGQDPTLDNHLVTKDYVDDRIVLEALTYYVSPSGSDSNDGSINSPFETLTHAVDLVRDMFIGYGSGSATIYLKDGVQSGYNGSLDFPTPFKVKIAGLNQYTTTVTDVLGVSGSAGSYQHEVELADVSSIEVGDIVGIYDATGGTNPTLIEGGWEVDAVYPAKSSIVYTCGNKSSNEPSGTVSASVNIHKARITGVWDIYFGYLELENIGLKSGFECYGAGTYVKFNNPMALVGTGTYVCRVEDYAALDAGGLLVGRKSGTGYLLRAASGGLISINNGSITGGTTGLWATGFSNVNFPGTNFNGNTYGVRCQDSSNGKKFSTCIFESNTNIDLYAFNGSFISASAGTNTFRNYTDAYDPNPNTEGNDFSYIVT